MTATMNSVDWRRPIERAITRADKHGTDLVSEIVGVIEAQVQGPIKPAANSGYDEAAQLRADLDQTCAELERVRAQVTELDAAWTKQLDERDKDNAKLADQLGELRRERDELLAKLSKPQPHRHQYVWTDPDDFPGPCECGKPNPRDPRQWVDDPDDDAGDSTVLAPWDQVISRVRDELEGVWP